MCVCVCKIVNVIGLIGMGGERDKKLEIFGLLNYGFSMYEWKFCSVYEEMYGWMG